MTVTVYTIYMTTSQITTSTLKLTSENSHIHELHVKCDWGREFKEITYPDDSLEFPTRSHIPYNLDINQGCDILEQDIPDVVISQVYTKYIHKIRKYIHGIEHI